VRQQLNLNDNQFNQLNRSHRQALNRFNRAAARINNNTGLNEQQRMQQLQRLQARFNQDFNSSLDSTFTDPRLRRRFNQLDTQFQGPLAFNDPAIRQQLNLTPAQQQQLRQLSLQWRQQLGELRAPRGNNSSLTQEEFNALRLQFQNQVTGILTPAQQQAFSQLVGQPFDFPVNMFVQPNANAAVQQGVNQPVQPNPQNQQIQRAQRNAPATQPQGAVR
jgi:hypothetical protein